MFSRRVNKHEIGEYMVAKRIQVNFKTTEELKAKAQRILAENRMSWTSYCNLALEELVRLGKIPFNKQ